MPSRVRSGTRRRVEHAGILRARRRVGRRHREQPGVGIGETAKRGGLRRRRRGPRSRRGPGRGRRRCGRRGRGLLAGAARRRQAEHHQEQSAAGYLHDLLLGHGTGRTAPRRPWFPDIHLRPDRGAQGYTSRGALRPNLLEHLRDVDRARLFADRGQVLLLQRRVSGEARAETAESSVARLSRTSWYKAATLTSESRDSESATRFTPSRSAACLGVQPRL
jgi:hypothetical protein